MRIGIDCRTILNPDRGEGAGLGHYTYQLVRHLLMIDKDNDYFLFFDKTVEPRRLEKFKKDNVTIRFFPFIQYKKFLPGGYSHFLVTAFISRHKLDVFHSPTLSLPNSYRGNAIVTAHDLAIYKFPEFYHNRRVSLLKSSIPQAIRQAKKIIAVSESTKKDLGEYFGTAREKVKVVYHGLDERFSNKSSIERIKAVKNKFNINGEYILFLGTLEPRKNIIRMISAYERLREREREEKNISKSVAKYSLVLAGANGFGFKDVRRRLKQSKYKDDIILPGYVQPDDLDPILEGAKIFLFPSLYEGFGLPIIEAMANGVPVITSNISSLPEIAKGYAFIVDPYSVAEIFQALYDLLTNSSLWKTFSQQGIARAKDFAWKKTATETLQLYQESIK